jgi:hypothetical protein
VLCCVQEKVTPDYSKNTPSDEDDDSSPSDVVTLTDSNFKEEVTDSEADVLVEFYAPWYVYNMHNIYIYPRETDRRRDESPMPVHSHPRRSLGLYLPPGAATASRSSRSTRPRRPSSRTTPTSSWP